MFPHASIQKTSSFGKEKLKSKGNEKKNYAKKPNENCSQMFRANDHVEVFLNLIGMINLNFACRRPFLSTVANLFWHAIT